MATIQGTAGADTLISGSGADTILAGDGNDMIIWDKGGDDVVVGNFGIDTLQVNETGTGRQFVADGIGFHHLVLNDYAPPFVGGGPAALQSRGGLPPTAPNPSATLDISDVEFFNVNLGVGTSFVLYTFLNTLPVESGTSVLTLDIDRSLFSATPADTFTINGVGEGETFSVRQVGSNQSELVIDENNLHSVVTTDIKHLMKFDSVTLKGGAEDDALHYVPTAASTHLSATGGRLVFTGGMGAPLTATGIEHATVALPGNGAALEVLNMFTSGLQTFTLDLRQGHQVQAAFSGATTGDNVHVIGGGDGRTILGLGPQILVQGSDPSNLITIDTGNGNDTVDAQAATAGGAMIDIRGGDGDDILVGGSGVILHGENGSDALWADSDGPTIFGFKAGETGSDSIVNFHAFGAIQDKIDLSGFQFRYAGNYAQFAAHNLVNDGHGGTNLITDFGQVIADIQMTPANQLWSGDFVFH